LPALIVPLPDTEPDPVFTVIPTVVLTDTGAGLFESSCDSTVMLKGVPVTWVPIVVVIANFVGVGGGVTEIFKELGVPLPQALIGVTVNVPLVAPLEKSIVILLLPLLFIVTPVPEYDQL
jgi:hypothetical protein